MLRENVETEFKCERLHLNKWPTAEDRLAKDAAMRLAYLLTERGDLDEAVQVLRARTDAGDAEAAGLLPRVLIEQGRRQEGQRLRPFGLTPDGSIASK